MAAMGEEEYINFLLSIGVNPYDPNQMAQLGGALPPLNEDGEFEYRNTNQFQDILQITSDPAFLAQLGDSDGGYSREDLQPKVTYEPVKAPGWQRTQQYAGSSDPVSRYIAEVMLDKGTAYQALVELQQIYADPTNELHAEIAPYILTDTDPVTGVTAPNWKRIEDIATGLEKDILYDPAFTDYDPTTGLPANATYEETPGGEYFRENSLPYPDERYGMETFRTPEKYDQTLRASRDIINARDKASRADAVMQAAMAKLALEAPSWTYTGIEGEKPEAVSPAVAAVERATFERGTPNLLTAGDEIQTQTPAAQRRQAVLPQRGQQGSPRTERYGATQRADIVQAARQRLDAQREAMERNYGYGRGAGAAPRMNVYERTLARELERQGRTPLNDTLAARRAAMARYGLQV